MGWGIEHTERGYEWHCINTAYGAAVGVEPTLAQAQIELYIAESAMFETPLPAAVKAAMRAEPERFAADMPTGC